MTPVSVETGVSSVRSGGPGRNSNRHSRRRRFYRPLGSPPAQPTHDGGDEGTRTPGLRDANAALSQLSYIPTGVHPADRVDRPGSVARDTAHSALRRPLDSADARGLALGLFASLAWGLVDISGALASRRLGSLRVLAGSQIVSLIALVVHRRRRPLEPGRRPDRGRPWPGSRWAFAAALAYLATSRRFGSGR